ncbi:hypothetical protein GIB67_029777 [Kingdonia uniflora]|uniref:Uncharacterized protein n=1 Tax=Kingdonia uniflora TaxID=39325 RepID=A0A7J7NIU3_9MAGN|nr:hypothetical protein GIB67_029777 [Kingdonia uniflora]
MLARKEAMNNGNNNKRRGPPPQTPQQQQPPSKRFQPSPTLIEEDEIDEDVFLEETLLREEEESLIIFDQDDRRQALASRLSKWKRPDLSPSYVSQSQNIIFQQLEIDHVIAESNKLLLPQSSGPAAILRIFGVTREGLILSI